MYITYIFCLIFVWKRIALTELCTQVYGSWVRYELSLSESAAPSQRESSPGYMSIEQENGIYNVSDGLKGIGLSRLRGPSSIENLSDSNPGFSSMSMTTKNDAQVSKVEKVIPCNPCIVLAYLISKP